MNRESESYFHFDPERPLYKTLSAPLDVQLELTTVCNNQCLYCYNFWEKSNFSPQYLEELQLKSIIQELVKNGVFYLTITGGEPLLDPSSLITTVKEAVNGGMVVSLNTNLALAPKDLLLKLKDLGLRRVLTSLISFDERTHDNITQRPGSYKETLIGIKNAKEGGLDLVVNMVVTRLNLSQVYQTGYFCADKLGVDHFCATKASPSLSNYKWILEYGLTPEEMRIMLEDLIRLRDDWGIKIDTLEPIPHCFLGDLKRFSPLSNRRCVAALTTCTVGADGSIRPCSHAERSYGNVFAKGLESSWLEMAQWRTGELIPSLCRECKQLAACGGGCRVAASITHAGNINAEDPFMGDPKDIVSLVLPSNKPFIADFTNFRFRLSSEIRFRPENFGGIIDNSQNRSLFVNSESFRLVERLTGRTFSVKDLADEENIPLENVKQFFQQLLIDKIIKKVD